MKLAISIIAFVFGLGFTPVSFAHEHQGAGPDRIAPGHGADHHGTALHDHGHYDEAHHHHGERHEHGAHHEAAEHHEHHHHHGAKEMKKSSPSHHYEGMPHN
ncbi:MAG: hypothetical protein HY073_00930 [Deltaproteobacteria bacterium]|nr:hypothetical protein [Deltaproteobacteria bacterium]